MKFLRIIVLILILPAIILNAEYYKNVVVIKFSDNSELLKNWNLNHRSGTITELSDILGNHTSKPFISYAVLQAIKNKEINSNFIYSTDKNQLANIAVVDYSSQIDPLVLSKKLSGYPGIEYAEPMPIHKLTFMPNDLKVNGQYYLDSVSAFYAWDVLDSNNIINVGIVDTGIDYLHPDLYANIYENPGETGLDSLGRDKKSNGVDDDHNGFIDDWHGWNFRSSDSIGQNNDPKPGNIHGTHVGGIVGAMINNEIGIAGTALYVKLIPVKTSSDNPLSGTVEAGYEGMLYAASLGAKVINCSWGSTTKAESEQEVIDKVIAMGSLVVGAAGNDGQYVTFYPAGYKGCLSVAAINSANMKAGFSNYAPRVDVSAPGEDILSTVPDSSYQFLNGTSMASPVAAAVVAMTCNKFPGYNPFQIKEQVKTNCKNIDSTNPAFIGLIGKGCVDAFKAVTSKLSRSVILNDYTIMDENGDGLLDKGEKVTISSSYLNILSNVKNVNVKLKSASFLPVPITRDSIYLGDMNIMEKKDAPGTFEFIVPDRIGYNFNLDLQFIISDSDGILNKETISLFMNPSYRTFDGNNLTVTLNSRGNIGYNDYSNNLQGIGFKYKDQTNLLFEGGLMVATSASRVSNVVRGDDQSLPDMKFNQIDVISKTKPGKIAGLEGFSSYADLGDSNCAGVKVNQSIYQFNDEANKDIIYSVYDIVNTSDRFFDSLYVGLFLDWDIGPSGSNNQADFDDNLKFGFASNVKDSTLPLAGVKLLSNQNLNYWAIDNGGTSADNPGVYSGFSSEKKWKMMTSGLKRKKSSVTDIGQVITAGPMKMLQGDTVRVTFALFASNNLDNLKKDAKASQSTSDKYSLSVSNYSTMPLSDDITGLFPNPDFNSNITVNYVITSQSDTRLDIYDSKGKLILNIINQNLLPGRYTATINPASISSGLYYLRLKTKGATISRGLSIIK